MSAEQLDKKLKKALENQSPAFDDNAWDKMEQLLDKHLPVKKDKGRRIFLLLFLFLSAGGAFYLFLANNNGNQQPVGNAENTSISVTPTDNTDKTKTVNNKLTPANSAIEPEQTTIAKTRSTNKQVILTEKTAKPLIFSKSTSEPIANKPVSNIKTDVLQENLKQDKNIVTENTIVVEEKSTDQPLTTDLPVSSHSEPVDLTTKHEAARIQIAENKDLVQEENSIHPDLQVSKKINPDKHKNNSSFLKGFFVSASAGADVSMVETNSIGEVKLVYGVGLGYNISRHFAVRTGFYVADKVYTADPEYYHPPNNFWSYYPNLKHVDADCHVYEVPLVVDYSFGFKKNHSWFASAGLSSLFMKKEEYSYYYKPILSPDYTYKTRTFEDENQHYFSILSLSGGYTTNLGSQFSLRAEPYFKIALSGVGYGNVNLNSGGLLISAIYRPFASKK